MNEEIRIYVADLAAYNNGKLHGVWIDATADLDEIWKAVNAMLKASPEGFAEEWAIHDYEGFGSYRLSEYEGFERVHAIARFIEEFPAIGVELLSHFGGDLDDARKAAEENYAGLYTSLADYAEELTDNTAEIPQNLAYYIDYERMGRDMELSGDIFTIETAHDEVHVFWSH
jgi:antirestriction protein